jgi:hypothetical protein
VEWDMTQDIPKAANLEGIDVTYEYYNLAGELLIEIPSESGEYKCVVVCANKNYVLTNNECIFEIIDSEVQ